MKALNETFEVARNQHSDFGEIHKPQSIDRIDQGDSSMTQSVRSLIVATDTSARCDRAMDRGLLLAKQWGSTMGVAHVLGRRERDQDAAAIEAKIRATLSDPSAPIQLYLAAGSVSEVLWDLVAEAGADLILTGVARYNDIGDYVLGTAVDHIVRNSTVPVLIVKRRPHHDFRTLLAATDLSDCSRDAILAAIGLFHDAQVHLIHAYHVPFETLLDSPDMRAGVAKEAEAELQKFLSHPDLERHRAQLHARIEYGETESVIADAIRETGADLLVLGAHSRSSFAHATIGSMAESILSWADIDILMVKND